ncbi:hemolysin D [Marinobacterium zhoushanense]|uniref:Hemolysin D n=1 Tax=Marinobacterium zhoushanense TaxID=1679163 RepID=A0ABQ1KE27_9GAMM|nr:efflux RND transporter periplasmic adaptor subunit [Marinobacterium zhoushanense]GGB92615.1 hemolysin D [Marinobacterium zhoushanense]
MTNGVFKPAALLLAGIALGGGAVYLTLGSPEDGPTASAEPQPLYWVAPMDPNYRRDKPGKSPMGMDLIPVYEESDAGGPDEGAGTITISPEVVNNLGVRTAAARQQPLNFEVGTVGYIQYNQDNVVHIHPRVAGWIERLHVKTSGERVTRGAPLYDLYSPELVNAQEELLFGLTRGDSRLTAAAETRLRSLNVSNGTIERIKRERRALQTVTFYAPADGVVDDFAVRAGFYVQPGMTLMSIGDLDEVWVEAEVFERQASLIEQGLPVTMTLDYLPGQEWRGQVDYVYPTLDPKTRTLRVRLRFANPDHALKPNMFAAISIHKVSDEHLLSVPREAVIRGGRGDRVVLALGEGRYKSVAVVTGRADNEQIEILNGLAEGERVVTSAQFLLDSESSKTSDFKRMHLATADTAGETEVDNPTSIWVEATINAVMADEMKINVDHASIPEWGWPDMRMDFPLAEWVDLSQLAPGSQAQIEISRLEGGGFQINDVYVTGKVPTDVEPSSGMEGMDHSTMDHSQMSMPPAQPDGQQ